MKMHRHDRDFGLKLYHGDFDRYVKILLKSIIADRIQLEVCVVDVVDILRLI